jgi:hypothetical protein
MPYWYWGAFTRPYDPQTCLSFATDSFQKNGLNVWVPPGGGYVTFAGAKDNSVAVQVTCAPQGGGSWVVVSTFADPNDPANNLAKTTHSNVVSDVQSTMVID